MNIGVRDRGDVANFLHLKMKCGPVLSGIRVMRRAVFETVPRAVPVALQDRGGAELLLRARRATASSRRSSTASITCSRNRSAACATACSARWRMSREVVLLLFDLYVFETWRWTRAGGAAGRRVRPLRVARCVDLRLTASSVCSQHLRDDVAEVRPRETRRTPIARTVTGALASVAIRVAFRDGFGPERHVLELSPAGSLVRRSRCRGRRRYGPPRPTLRISMRRSVIGSDERLAMRMPYCTSMSPGG